jgi:predicted nicotinamide N-methyase
MHLRAGGRVLELDDPTSSSMAPIFSDMWLGTELWPAARALVALLEERRPMLAAAAQVLELGAGTGACGLAAAALGARRVLLTDKPVLLPVMRANVAANRFDGCLVECAELTWRSPGDERRSPGDESEEHGTEGTDLPDRLPAGAELVLASDCLNPVYGHGHAAALAATIHCALALALAAAAARGSSARDGTAPQASSALSQGAVPEAVPEALLAQTRRGDMCAVTLTLTLTL